MNEFERIVENIIRVLKNNDESFKKLYNIDKSHYKCDVKNEKMEAILLNYRESVIQNVDKETVIVIYNGNPYLTLKLCLEAILNHKDIILYPSDFMVGINSFIVEIIQNSQKISDIKIVNDISKIKENIEAGIKTICIDKEYMNDFIDENKIENVKLEMLEKINMYCDDDKFVDLRDVICDYANNNHIALEIFDDVPKNEIIDLLKNYAKGEFVLILSSDQKFITKLESEIKESKVIINKNPFNFETEKISKKIF